MKGFGDCELLKIVTQFYAPILKMLLIYKCMLFSYCAHLVGGSTQIVSSIGTGFNGAETNIVELHAI